MLCRRSCGQAYTGTGERAGRFQTTARKKVDWFLEVGSSKPDLKTLETLETVPAVLQQPCWHFVQENAGIEPHGLGK